MKEWKDKEFRELLKTTIDNIKNIQRGIRDNFTFSSSATTYSNLDRGRIACKEILEYMKDNKED